MKMSPRERDELRRRVVAARARSPLSNAEIARATGVDPGQVSKVCRGNFATLSDSAVRIFTVLGVEARLDANATNVDATPLAGEAARRAAAWRRLEQSVRRAWDETPDGAERLARVLDALAGMARP